MTNEEFIQSITLPGEEWKSITEFDYPYSISSFGRLVAHEFTIKGMRGQLFHRPHKLLSIKPSKCNGILYYRIHANVNGKSKCFSLHRLVAKYFLPNPHNHNEVDHIDRNGLNNHISNLRWVSHKENYTLNTITREAMSKSHIGKPNPHSFTPIVQLKDGNVIREYDCVKRVKEYGFRPGNIACAISGRAKSSAGYQWIRKSDYESQVSMSKNSI